jgi:predicted ATPase
LLTRLIYVQSNDGSVQGVFLKGRACKQDWKFQTDRTSVIDGFLLNNHDVKGQSCRREVIMNKQLKLVVTGGPGGGKTTALDLFRRELSDKLAIVPEAATVLFSGGITRTCDEQVLKTVQKTIFVLQQNLEEIYHKQYPNRVLVCDRGTLDGQAYWPGAEDEFFKEVNSNLESEIARYDAVIFFESAASSGNDISSNNPVRNESSERAAELDEKLQRIWSRHPNFYFVGSSESFIRKIMFGIMTIENVISMKNKDKDKDK